MANMSSVLALFFVEQTHDSDYFSPLQLKQNTGHAFATAAEVWRTEGAIGFWRGNLVNILRTAPFKAVNFFAFDSYHKLLVYLTKEEGNTARFAAGACAGEIHTFFVPPPRVPPSEPQMGCLDA